MCVFLVSDLGGFIDEVVKTLVVIGVSSDDVGAHANGSREVLPHKLSMVLNHKVLRESETKKNSGVSQGQIIFREEEDG